MFCGIDCSTQSLKVVVVDASHVIHHEVVVSFDQDLSHYRTQQGITRSTYGVLGSSSVVLTAEERKTVDEVIARDPLIVTSPSLMFVEALDCALDRLKKQRGVDLSRIVSVSGSGQQHGSIWWKGGAEQNVLRQLQSTLSLSEQLTHAFSLPHAPIWMDSSTHQDCQEVEQAVGGPQRLAELTGSRAYERFTGNQIRKIKRLLPSVWQQTERISLVSSLLACLLLGRYAEIDASDAAGMNIMNIGTHDWEPAILQAIDSTGTLVKKLGAVVDSNTVLGNISKYFVERYGFSAQCKVVACSGDNPCTLAGMDLTQPGDVGVSLGTSDTVFAVVATPKPSKDEGHVFVNPVAPSSAMLMAVFKNGSLTRERVRNAYAHASWAEFNQAIDATPVGNDHLLKFTYLESEITPTTHATGTFRFDAHDQQLVEKEFPSIGHECRGLIEGQFLSMRAHASHLGLHEPKRIVASGGASVNRHLLQILANVFAAPVQVQVLRDTRTGTDAAVSNTAALGAAFRAQWAVNVQTTVGNETSQHPSSAASNSGGQVVFVTAAEPNPEAVKVYQSLSARFQILEKVVCDKLKQHH